MNLFDNVADDRVFENRDVLLDQFVPENLVEREEQLNELGNALVPAFAGESPDHIFAFGPNGSGKTASTRLALNDLKNHSESADITDVWVNCNGIESEYDLLLRLIEQLVGEDVSRGRSTKDYLERLFDELNEIGGTVILVLDEVSNIEDLDTFFYAITRARSAGGRLDDARVGVIGLSKSNAFYKNLSSDAKSTLNHHTIDFPAYDANELRAILNDRVNLGFDDDAVEDGVVPLAAANAARRSGDARLAIDLLRQAGDSARADGTGVVTEEHVEDAIDELLTDYLTTDLHRLSDGCHDVYYALATLAGEGETEPSTSKVYKRYKTLLEAAGKDPLVRRRVQSFLNDLAELELLSQETRNSNGQWKTHTLSYELGTVVDALQEVGTFGRIGAHSSIAGLVNEDE